MREGKGREGKGKEGKRREEGGRGRKRRTPGWCDSVGWVLS